MEGTFLDIIRAAHQDGDLTEVPMVKRALMYQNYSRLEQRIEGVSR